MRSIGWIRNLGLFQAENAVYRHRVSGLLSGHFVSLFSTSSRGPLKGQLKGAMGAKSNNAIKPGNKNVTVSVESDDEDDDDDDDNNSGNSAGGRGGRGRRAPASRRGGRSKAKQLATDDDENMWKFSPRQFRVILKNEVVVRPTTTAGVYCCTDDNGYNLAPFAGAASEIFNSRVRYVPPQDFNYSLPTNKVAEFAFIGRSNVGKSSLIGALTGDEKLVRISREPGCTKSINYFAFVKDGFELYDKKNPVNGHMLYLVDLPGYGFAKVSKKSREQWKETIDSFVLNRSFDVLR